MSNDPYSPPNDPRERIAYNRQRMANRPIFEEKVVHYSEFPNLQTTYTQLGLFSFLDLDEVIYPSFIREFYSNLELISARRIKFTFFNSTYSWPLSYFAKVMRVPVHGHKFYNPRTDLRSLNPTFPVTELISNIANPDLILDHNRRIKVEDSDIRHDLQLHLTILRHNIFCREHTVNFISATEAAILWTFTHEGEQTSINTAFVMMMRMSNLHLFPNRSLPYAIHLNRLFAHIGEITPLAISRPISSIPITAWIATHGPIILISSDSDSNSEDTVISDALSSNAS